MFKVGQKVTSDIDPIAKNIIRKVTKVVPSSHCRSGYLVSTDGGGKCPCCGRQFAIPVEDIDSAWFIRIT